MYHSFSRFASLQEVTRPLSRSSALGPFFHRAVCSRRFSVLFGQPVSPLPFQLFISVFCASFPPFLLSTAQPTVPKTAPCCGVLTASAGSPFPASLSVVRSSFRLLIAWFLQSQKATFLCAGAMRDGPKGGAKKAYLPARAKRFTCTACENGAAV